MALKKPTRFFILMSFSSCFPHATYHPSSPTHPILSTIYFSKKVEKSTQGSVENHTPQQGKRKNRRKVEKSTPQKIGTFLEKESRCVWRRKKRRVRTLPMKGRAKLPLTPSNPCLPDFKYRTESRHMIQQESYFCSLGAKLIFSYGRKRTIP